MVSALTTWYWWWSSEDETGLFMVGIIIAAPMLALASLPLLAVGRRLRWGP